MGKKYCNVCGSMTFYEVINNHEEIQSEILDEKIDDYGNVYNETLDHHYTTLTCKCLGCHDIFLEKKSVSYWGSDEILSYEEIFPKRNDNSLKMMGYINIPDSIKIIYEEVIKTYNEKCYLLCSIGLRTLLEALCVERGIKDGTLEAKIDKLDFITQNIKDNLHKFRYLGNEATHDFIAPDKNELRLSIEVIEDLMKNAYDFDYNSLNFLSKYQDKVSNRKKSSTSCI